MKKVGLVIKEVSQGIIKDSLKESEAVFLVKYSGLSSPDMSLLRQNLRSARAKLFVVKNSVAQRVLKDSSLESFIKLIDGPCGLIFIKDEPVDASRILCNFTKDHEQLKLQGGTLKEKFLEKKDIESMAKLPSKDVLRAQVVMTLNSPISGLVITLNQVLAKFVYCIDRIREKRQTN